MDYFDWAYGIVPLDYPDVVSPGGRTPGTTEAPSRQPMITRSYEEPWYVDTINRAIERAAQVASLEAAGYPPYPEYRTQAPQTVPLPAPTPGVQPQAASLTVPTDLIRWIAIGGAFLLVGALFGQRRR